MVDTWRQSACAVDRQERPHLRRHRDRRRVEVLQVVVIVEDDCFIGAALEVAEGVVVEGSVISMGVFLVVDRATGEVGYGRVPAYSWSSRTGKDAAAAIKRRNAHVHTGSTSCSGTRMRTFVAALVSILVAPSIAEAQAPLTEALRHRMDLVVGRLRINRLPQPRLPRREIDGTSVSHMPVR